MTPDEVDEYWNKVFWKNRLKSHFPPSDFMSSDLTESYTLTGFWIESGIIVPLEEHNIIRDIFKYV